MATNVKYIPKVKAKDLYSQMLRGASDGNTKGMKEVEMLAYPKTPKDTGRMRSLQNIDPTKVLGNEIHTTISNDAPYSIYVHEGGKKRWTTPGTNDNWLQETLFKHADNVMDHVGTEIMNEIK